MGPLPLYKIAPSLVFTQSRRRSNAEGESQPQKKDTHKHKGGRCKACASEVDGGARTKDKHKQRMDITTAKTEKHTHRRRTMHGSVDILSRYCGNTVDIVSE